ncbi:putative non-specific serine/threonine protein kinase [Medicago truncatula]|uniref:Putative non-specific serine/threonine protein kinase n=1 Tax=Medicago truncatula TaxID=3880 RepID=A0A396JK48_MEDTR|nr:putative non-specific serine/threonine protein kinase [Medicago truncatula]
MSTGPTINATSTVPLIITPGDLPPATTLPSQTPPSSKESPSPLPSISTGAIVGIAIGAVVILMVLLLLCICCCKKKKRRRDEERCAREQSDRERSQHQNRRLSQRTKAKQKKVQGPKLKNDSKSPSPAPIQSGQLPVVASPKSTHASISSRQPPHAALPTLTAPPLVSSSGGSGSKPSGHKLPPSLGTGLKSETNKAEMATPFEVKTRPFVFIKDINVKKDFWKMAVKVRDKWTVVKDGREHSEMVIVDAKGTDVQVIIPTEYKAETDKMIEENTTYTLSNFLVLTNDLSFKASDNKYKLIWTGGTTAVDPNVHDIPDKDLKFKPFAEIVDRKWRSDLLYHVIGYVHEIGYRQGVSKKRQVNLTLKDLSDISLNCTLSEDYAAKFDKFNNDNKESGPVILMLKYGKIKEEGKYLSVTNTYGATKMLINADISHIKTFRESLPKNDQMMTQSQVMCTQSSAGSQFSTDDDLLSNPLIMPLSDILQLEQISYVVTVAKIEKVNSTKFGWYYLACDKCGKIAKGDKPPYTCEKGHNTEKTIERYKLEMDVLYGDTKATFVFWDRESTQLLGISAAQLRINMIQAGITNRLEYPMLMDSIGGKTMAFKIKWQPKCKTISVVCYRQGDVLAKLVSSKFPEAVIDDLHAESADDVENTPDGLTVTEEVTMSVDVSATAEYNPVTLSQLTPMSDKSQGKTSNDTSDDKFTLKRVKVIKTEKK